MVDSIINFKNNNKKQSKADVMIIGAPYEKTASSRKGTKDGPKAILAMLDEKLELFDRTYKVEIPNKVSIGQEVLKGITSLEPLKALFEVTSKCKKILDRGEFPILLGGEHSMSLGLLSALAKKLKPKDVTILTIDAHCDLRDSDADYHDHPSNLAHSCVFRRAHELGYNLVQVGIRTYSVYEYDYFSDPKNNIKVFEWGMSAQSGNGNKVPDISEILQSIKTKYIYISIDVDGFDPAFMPATGTPVQGGLEWWYGMELIERAIKEKELVGADIMEVSPIKDSVLTEYGAAQLLYSIIAHKFRDKLK